MSLDDPSNPPEAPDTRSRPALERWIDAVNESVGRTVAWLFVAMIVVQMGVVVFRYVFGLGDPVAQDLILYMHAIAFMTLAGYTLRHDAHVRVDVFYRRAAPRTKAAIDCGGVILFLWPMTGVMLWKSWPYVAEAWRIREGSVQISGLQGNFILKTFLLVFAGLVALQGLALFSGALRRLLRPGAR